MSLVLSVIGIVVGLFEKHYLSSNINLFLKTGVCGGFTTCSTFSLETLTLLENGMPSIAMIYAFVSIIGMRDWSISRKNNCWNKSFVKGSFFLYYLKIKVYNMNVKVYEFLVGNRSIS